MHPKVAVIVAFVCGAGSIRSAEDSGTPAIRHSFLVLGGKTAIINEEGKAAWEYYGGSRDGFVIPSGNLLLAYSDRAVEVTRDKQIVFSYQCDKANAEIGTAQRLYNGNTLV